MVDLTLEHPRMLRERRTIEAMMWIFCRDHHEPVPRRMCSECDQLLAYAYHKLELCPFQEDKSTCASCRIHCYEPDERARVQQVMRYAGPRMLLKHPLRALRHLLDGRTEPPDPQLYFKRKRLQRAPREDQTDKEAES